METKVPKIETYWATQTHLLGLCDNKILQLLHYVTHLTEMEKSPGERWHPRITKFPTSLYLRSSSAALRVVFSWNHLEVNISDVNHPHTVTLLRSFSFQSCSDCLGPGNLWLKWKSCLFPKCIEMFTSTEGEQQVWVLYSAPHHKTRFVGYWKSTLSIKLLNWVLNMPGHESVTTADRQLITSV